MVVPVAVVLIRLGGIVYRASNTPTGRALIKKLLEKGGKIVKNTKTDPKTLTGTVATDPLSNLSDTKAKCGISSTSPSKANIINPPYFVGSLDSTSGFIVQRYFMKSPRASL